MENTNDMTETNKRILGEQSWTQSKRVAVGALGGGSEDVGQEEEGAKKLFEDLNDIGDEAPERNLDENPQECSQWPRQDQGTSQKGDMNEEAKDLLTRYVLDDLITPLTKKGCKTISHLAGLPPTHVEGLKSFEVESFKSMVEEAKLLASLKTLNLTELQGMLQNCGVYSFLDLRGLNVEIFVQQEEFGDLNDQAKLRFESLLRRVGNAPARSLVAPAAKGVVNDTIALTDPIEQSEFHHYIEVGRDLRVIGSDSCRVVKEIEDVLEGHSPEQTNTKVTRMVPSTFFALLAPSLSGKTQLAFALRRRRPLYFAMGQYHSEKTQTIYKCFGVLNEAIERYAAADQMPVKVRAQQDYSQIKFWVLGLIKVLIEDGIGYVDTDLSDPNGSWLKHYIQEKVLKVVPMSVPDFKRDPVFQQLGQYVLFLDEFAASESLKFSAALVRNLARAVGLKVICAGTNAAGASLVGRSSSAQFSGSNNNSWCIVLPILPPSSPALKTKGLVAVSKLRQSNRCSTVLCEFLEDQVKVSRGGVSFAIIEAIEAIANNVSSTDAAAQLNLALLEYIVGRVKFVIIERKDMDRNAACKARLALCLCNYYEDEVAPKQPQHVTLGVPEAYASVLSLPPPPVTISSSSAASDAAAQRISSGFCSLFRPDILEKQRELWSKPDSDSVHFLNMHYFRIAIPNGSSSTRFIDTLVKGNNERDGGELKYRQGRSISVWDQRTCFSRDEVILQLASFDVNLERLETVRNMIIQADSTAHQKCGPTQNPAAITSGGLLLENVVHVSIIESSHRGQCRLAGIELGLFLQFVFANLMISTPSDIRIADNSGFFQLVEGLSVPFLNAADLEWSDKLKSIEGLNFGHYRRHPNADGIDGSFELRSNSNDWFDWAVVECKNWKDCVDVDDYVGILEKGWNWSRNNQPLSDCPNGTLLHLMFCSDLANFQEQSTSRETAMDNNWCVFRIRRSDINGPAAIETVIQRNSQLRPAVVGIIFESGKS